MARRSIDRPVTGEASEDKSMTAAGILATGIAFCFIGVLSGTSTMRRHPIFQKYAILFGVGLMVVATFWAFLDPASWAAR